MLVVPLYAALLALLFVALTLRTIRLRRRYRVALGDGAHPALLRAMRAHANFAEYVPLALVLFYFAEIGGAPQALAHLLGGSLLIGRCLHAWGVSQARETFAFRVTGMALTLGGLLTAGSYVVFAYGSSALLDY